MFYYFSSSEICSLLKGNFVDLKSEPARKLSSSRDHKTVIIHYQGWHRLEKYLNMQTCLEKSLKST